MAPGYRFMVASDVISQPQSCKGNLRMIGDGYGAVTSSSVWRTTGGIPARCRMPSCGLRPVKRSYFRVLAALPSEPEPEMDPRYSLDESISTRSYGNPQARASAACRFPTRPITENTRLRSSLIAAPAPLNAIFPSTALRRLEHHRCFSCICRKYGPRCALATPPELARTESLSVRRR